jgi:hypothetical protein
MSLFRSARLLAIAAGVFLLSGVPMPAQADWISDWNQAALEAGRDNNELAPEIARSMAMLSSAIYNAVEGISGNYNLYSHGTYSGPSGTAVSRLSLQLPTLF